MPAPTRAQVLTPFESMDVMSYSYTARDTLAKISRELGNGQEEFWQQQAQDVRQRLIDKLWDPARHACFDRDKNGKPMRELIHNNIRAIYYGIFTQRMADEFVKHHLLNPHEFWTPFPLPSIAVKDPLFRNDSDNSWAGQPEALTYQRAIRALENYGYYAEVTELGQKLIQAVERGGDRFTQQFDPFTGKPTSPKQDGYGPAILSVLEYISRLHGVYVDLANDRVWWSACDGEDFTYAQRWGGHEWQLSCAQGRMRGCLNGRELFTSTSSVRVATDLEGKVVAVIGIKPTSQRILLNIGPVRRRLFVKPNQTIFIGPLGPTPETEHRQGQSRNWLPPPN